MEDTKLGRYFNDLPIGIYLCRINSYTKMATAKANYLFAEVSFEYNGELLHKQAMISKVGMFYIRKVCEELNRNPQDFYDWMLTKIIPIELIQFQYGKKSYKDFAFNWMYATLREFKQLSNNLKNQK